MQRMDEWKDLLLLISLAQAQGQDGRLTHSLRAHKYKAAVQKLSGLTGGRSVRRVHTHTALLYDVKRSLVALGSLPACNFVQLAACAL